MYDSVDPGGRLLILILLCGLSLLSASAGRAEQGGPRPEVTYFNFDSREGLAFHEYTLPGGPTSHGGIRLLARDPRWLYDWGDGWTLDPRTGRAVSPGTPVLILGPYGYDDPPLWRSPDWLRRPVELP